MKKTCIFFAQYFAAAILAFANDTNKVETYDSFDLGLIQSSICTETRSNIFVVFRAEADGIGVSEFASDEPIRFGFVVATNAPERNYHILMPDSTYAYKISLFTTNGELLSPTALGKTYGHKFSELNKFYDKSKLDWSKNKWDRHPDRMLPYLSFASKSFSLSRGLPPPEKLFKMPNPGNYVMTVELQVWSRPSKKDKANTLSLVTFPAAKLTVFKKTEKK